MKAKKDVSVVIPVYNEEQNIEDCYLQVSRALRQMKDKRSEIIFIDDGSSDNTPSKLQEIFQKDNQVKIIQFRKNFGQTSAMAAGFSLSEGEIIVSMDADLQNDPTDIPLLMAKIDEGYDIVSGWRRERKDKLISRRIPSILANKIISFTTGVRLHDYGCTLKAFRKEVIKNINLYGEMHRFIPAVASWMGTRITEVPVKHRPRTRGKSKYGITRTFRVILDLITVKFLLSFSTKPIQIFGIFGLSSLFFGSVFFLRVIIQRQFYQIPADRPLLLISIFLIFAGLQFILMGLLAEMQIRIYHESQNKPIYAIKNVLQHE
ncbi:MAG: glycosyltransferase family 2 protein [Candidatus Aureabacteria bacterium]|nr:glycosyltransferase family 2 protein [Candidatus Auribacterota bacterium]